MVMIEALACGTPVVARPFGAAPEIVEDGVTGFLRTEEDVRAAALIRAAELDRHACRGSVEKRFSAARMAQDHVDLFERVLDNWQPDRGTVGPRMPEVSAEPLRAHQLSAVGAPSG